jgi:hypothetical protein
MKHQYAFECIKALVVGWGCLMMIDHEKPGDNKIFVTCNASKRRMGAVLSFGPTWKTACPVAFESRALGGAELNYPVHEQEMLAIVRALKKWRTDLLGSHVEIVTDHRTLENFAYQKELLKRQVRWMEYLSQYEYTITYIPGEDNTVADVLFRLPDENGIVDVEACTVFSIEGDTNWARRIKKGYRLDPWCMGIIDDLARGVLDKKLEISLKNGLLFIGTWLVIPKWKSL